MRTGKSRQPRGPRDPGGAHARFPAWKRACDLLLVSLFAPVWLPLMGMISVAIKIVSGGPVLFRQQRVGLEGKLFPLLKFRSMPAGTDEKTHRRYMARLIREDRPMKKLDSQCPLIPLGRFLRASGLDELPQLLNVLRGEMSLVGPRPCLPYEFARYSKAQRARVSVPPGLTGLWQVSGKNRTTFNQMIALDMEYARRMSLRSDLTVILKTGPVLLDQMLQLLPRRKPGSRSVLRTKPLEAWR